MQTTAACRVVSVNGNASHAIYTYKSAVEDINALYCSICPLYHRFNMIQPSDSIHETSTPATLLFPRPNYSLFPSAPPAPHLPSRSPVARWSVPSWKAARRPRKRKLRIQTCIMSNPYQSSLITWSEKTTCLVFRFLGHPKLGPFPSDSWECTNYGLKCPCTAQVCFLDL